MSFRCVRNFLLSPKVIARYYAINPPRTVSLVIFDKFKDVEKKDRENYLAMIKRYEETEIRRRGHVEFIYSALKHMKEFGVHKDLEVYKALLEIFPKGRLLPKNIFQAELMHYPKQQQCAVDVLDQMEDNGVMPDYNMQDILMSIFGRRGIPIRKFGRMMYWMPKFKNISPWRLPERLPNDAIELARLAIKRITSVDPDTKITLFETKEIDVSLEDTWIVSAQSPSQKSLLSKQPPEEPLTVYGAFTVFLKDQMVHYFTLIGATRTHKPNYPEDDDDVSNIKIPFVFGSIIPANIETVHEQDDGTILAICATGTSSRDSLLSWIRMLEKNGNPALANLPVIFTLTAPSKAVTVQEPEPITTNT